MPDQTVTFSPDELDHPGAVTLDPSEVTLAPAKPRRVGDPMTEVGTDPVSQFAGGFSYQLGHTLAELGQYLPGDIGSRSKEILATSTPPESLPSHLGSFTETGLELGGGASAGELAATRLLAPTIARTAPAVARVLPYLGQGAGSALAAGAQTGGDPTSMAVAGTVGAAAPAAFNVLASRLAQSLPESAIRNYVEMFAPRGKPNIAKAEKIAPELAARQFVATSKDDLLNTSAEKMAQSGQAIDDYMQANGSVPVQGKGGTAITSEIDKAISAMQRGGVTPQTNQAYVDTLNAFKKDVANLAQANGGKLTLEDARWLRQQYDATAAAKHAFALPPAEQSRIKAIADASNTLRRVIADQNPALAAANKEYNLWSRVNDLANDMPAAKPTLAARFVGGMVGRGLTAKGGPLAEAAGTYAGQRATETLARMQASPLWKTLPAAVKMQMANYANAGDVNSMFSLAVKTAPAAMTVDLLRSQPAAATVP